MLNLPNKYCTVCKKNHIVELFYPDKRSKSGYMTWCKKAELALKKEKNTSCSDIEMRIAKRTRLPINYTKLIFDAYLEVVHEEIEKDGKVWIPDVGVIHASHTKDKLVYDINTKQLVLKTNRVIVKFVPSIELKKEVKKNGKNSI